MAIKYNKLDLITGVSDLVLFNFTQAVVFTQFSIGIRSENLEFWIASNILWILISIGSRAFSSKKPFMFIENISRLCIILIYYFSIIGVLYFSHFLEIQGDLLLLMIPLVFVLLFAERAIIMSKFSGLFDDIFKGSRSLQINKAR